MIDKISSIQIFFLILGSTSNLRQPEYPVEILNTENIIFSLGDTDDYSNNDLEIIKNFTENSQMERKFKKFHKDINLIEKAEKPEQKYYFGSQQEIRNLVPLFKVSYPDSQHVVNKQHLSMLERQKYKKSKRKKKRWKSYRMKNAKGKKKRWKSYRMKNAKGKKKRQPILAPLDFEDTEAEDDYMEKEYLDYLIQSRQNNTAFKYSNEGKPEESVNDVIQKIVDIKTPKNCTNVTGIGLQAVECIVKSFKDGEYNKKQMIYNICTVLFVWFCIYLAIALPLWCLKGWCCCCCRCSFCFPNKTVDEIQKYIAQNPPGVHINSNGMEEQYKPTQKETELYERLKRLIAEF